MAARLCPRTWAFCSHPRPLGVRSPLVQPPQAHVASFAPALRPPAARLFSSSAVEPREAMDYDVVIVGAGPAGLAAAIRLKQKAQKEDKDISVCIVEKGAEVGAHILSGNVFNPVALNELIPDWKEKGAPLDTPVKEDKFYFLTEKYAVPLPVVPLLNNHGNYVISLGDLCRWLAVQAEELGVEIYPGFSASEVLIDDNNTVKGIATSDMGIGKDGKPKDTFMRGMELRAKLTVLAEGVRGSLSEDVMEHYNLREKCDPQTYGIGLKEVWEIDQDRHVPGRVQHTIGFPSRDWTTYQGTFMYHMNPNKILIGLVLGLDYRNPNINPYEEFQMFKTHPIVADTLRGGTCISYGARAINEGGFQAIPKLTFPGGMLVGCSAGFLNVPTIKGSHYAMKSGMCAADTAYDTLEKKLDVGAYEQRIKESFIYKDLKAVRNIKPGFKLGLLPGVLHSGLEALVLKGKAPWTLRHKKKDSEATEEVFHHPVYEYPKPDGVLTFDLLTNLQRSGTYHDDDQPSHLKIKEDKKDAPVESYKAYGAPETRFCPAKVYEFVENEPGKPELVINAQNCLHCKTCSIKMPMEYIKWTVPEGGGGPNYQGM